MKICKQGLYVQIIDGIGTVRMCGWAGYYKLGNLLENSLDELYHNDKAQAFFKSLSEQTYDYCSEENCPYMANNTLDSMLIDIDEIPKYPEIISLAYDRRCNYQCTCCCSKCNDAVDFKAQEKIECEIEKALPYVKELSANGLGEFFVSDSMIRLVNKWNPINREHARFTLETNASLFNENNWKRIENIGNYYLHVDITVMSFDEMTYQYLAGTKLGIQNIINNLKFIKTLREKGIINYLELCTVVQERNFRSLPEFVRRCLEEFGTDLVRVRRFLPEKAMDENVEWFFDVRNPMHPYHKEYLKIMSDPIFKDPRVFKWTGDNLSNRGDIPARAGFRVMKKLFLSENVEEKLSSTLLARGYNHIVLYALGDLCKATLMKLANSGVAVDYILDAHTSLTEYSGYEVKQPTVEQLKTVQVPILVTLAARHNEMDEFIRHRGFQGVILSLEEMLDEALKND